MVRGVGDTQSNATFTLPESGLPPRARSSLWDYPGTRSHRVSRQIFSRSVVLIDFTGWLATKVRGEEYRVSSRFGVATASGDSVAELNECKAVLRAMALHAAKAVDQERSRIARGLHDELGQVLAAVQLRLAELDRSSTEEARRTLIEKISDLVGEAVESSRSLTFELMAPALPEYGIEAELEQLTALVSEQHGLRYRFDSDTESKPLGGEQARTLLLVAGELLRNVGKHAQAERVSVEVTRAGDRIQVVVGDDGIGFANGRQSQLDRWSCGLVIVKERLAEIGGEVAINSYPGSGTRIEITAPLLET